MTLHITQFEGSNALSSFRVQQLLPSLQAVNDKIVSISARFVHLVATDIAHNCGLAVHGIGRLVEYRITLKNGLLSKAALSAEQLEQVAALLYDRMTESAMLERAQALGLFGALQAAPKDHVDVLSIVETGWSQSAHPIHSWPNRFMNAALLTSIRGKNGL